MRTVSWWIRARLIGDQSGMSLAEVLVSMVIFVGVLAGILSLLDTSTKVAANEQERPLGEREAQVGLHRMTREIRQAYRVAVATENVIDFNVTLNDRGWHVRYECDWAPPAYAFRQCTRQATLLPPDGSGNLADNPRVIVVDRVLNGTTADPVFSGWTPLLTETSQPKYVKVTVKIPAGGERNNNNLGNGGYKHSVVLADGVYLRNLNLAG